VKAPLQAGPNTVAAQQPGEAPVADVVVALKDADVANGPAPPTQPHALVDGLAEVHGETRSSAFPCPLQQWQPGQPEQPTGGVPASSEKSPTKDLACAAEMEGGVFPTSPAVEERPTEVGSDVGQIRALANEVVGEEEGIERPRDETATGAMIGALEAANEIIASPVAPSTREADGASAAVDIEAHASSSPALSKDSNVAADVVVSGKTPPSAEATAGEESPAFAVNSATSEPSLLPPTAPAAAAASNAQAWIVDFGTSKPKPKRKMTKKEKDAIQESRLRSQASGGSVAASVVVTGRAGDAVLGLGADSEGNIAVAAAGLHDGAALQVVQLDGLADRAAQVPTNLTTTRADLEQRLVLRLPRLLCVNKQYPRGCGIASLTSIYNYLYSWLGESAVGATRPPHSQEELMSILGFEPPFGEIAWGPFTGNSTLIRWFHALNRHFGLRGRAHILYKAHGHGKTTHLYPDNTAALVAVKAALRDPHCALIYHCYNHYMVPVGYQEIPHAQTDFLKPTVPVASCDTTIFIGEVSRGRHEAMYARKWEQVVKDIECKSPLYFNIRHPEKGVQRREPKPKKTAATAEADPTRDRTVLPSDAMQSSCKAETQGEAPGVGAESSATPLLTPPPPTLFIPMPASLRGSNTRDEVSVASIQREPAGASSEATQRELGAETTPQATAELGGVPPTHAAASGHSSFTAQEPNTMGGHAGDVIAPPCTRADAAANDDVIAETAEPSASPVTQASDAGEITGVAAATATAASQLPSPAAVIEHPKSAVLAGSASPLPADRPVVSPKPTSPTTAAVPGGAKPKKERGNLHCLILFRNDQVEEHLDRYEDGAAEEEVAAGSNTDESSSSDEDAQ
jgi:hypothetical protein